MSGFDALADMDIKPSMHLYVRVNDDFDIRARMFAPLSGVLKTPPLEAPAVHSPDCWLITRKSRTAVSPGASPRE
jgi:hypothetical protein